MLVSDTHTTTPATPPSSHHSSSRLRPCQRGWRQKLWAGTLALFLVGQVAQADIIITVQEVGGNVVISYSGMVDTRDFPTMNVNPNLGHMTPSNGSLAFAGAWDSFDTYGFAPFNLTFGTGNIICTAASMATARRAAARRACAMTSRHMSTSSPAWAGRHRRRSARTGRRSPRRCGCEL